MSHVQRHVSWVHGWFLIRCRHGGLSLVMGWWPVQFVPHPWPNDDQDQLSHRKIGLMLNLKFCLCSSSSTCSPVTEQMLSGYTHGVAHTHISWWMGLYTLWNECVYPSSLHLYMHIYSNLFLHQKSSIKLTVIHFTRHWTQIPVLSCSTCG